MKEGQYRMLYRPTHPLAGKADYLPEHRVLLWDRVGPGPHSCHYCASPIDWMPGERTKRGALVVDHLDRDSTNNEPANLVAACQSCNQRNSDRSVQVSEPHRVRTDGSRLRGETRPCERCGETFIRWTDPRPNRGRFCSRSCARKAQPSAA